MSSLYQNLVFEVNARTQNLFKPKPNKKLVYIHIPKCGGVSISKALKACYAKWNPRDSNLYRLNLVACYDAAQRMSGRPLDVDDPEVSKLRQELLIYGMSLPKVEFVSGHCMFSSLAYQAFHKDYDFVVMLRDPVKRWISNYFYNRYKPFDMAKTDLELESYLESEDAKVSGQTYARYLCGLTEAEDYSSSDILAKAKENLHKFSVVGCIEHLDVFKQHFHTENWPKP